MVLFALENRGRPSVWMNNLPVCVLNDAHRKIVVQTHNATCAHIYMAVSTKVVQKSVKAYATMPKGSLGDTQ